MLSGQPMIDIPKMLKYFTHTNAFDIAIRLSVRTCTLSRIHVISIFFAGGASRIWILVSLAIDGVLTLVIVF